jgi:hypothetical protein
MITYERVRSFTVSMNLATYPPPKWLNHHGAHVGCSHFVHLCRVRRPGFCDTFALGTKPACTLFQQIQNTSIFRNQIQFSVFTRWYHGCSIIFPWFFHVCFSSFSVEKTSSPFPPVVPDWESMGGQLQAAYGIVGDAHMILWQYSQIDRGLTEI